MSFVTAGRGEVRLSLRVQPRASRNRVGGIHGGRLKVQVSAPPVDGAANTAVLAILADWLALPRRNLTVLQGDTAREKVIAITTDHPAELAERIERLACQLNAVRSVDTQGDRG